MHAAPSARTRRAPSRCPISPSRLGLILRAEVGQLTLQFRDLLLQGDPLLSGSSPNTARAHNNICNTTATASEPHRGHKTTVSSTQTLPEKRLQRAMKCVAGGPQ
eukprot:11617138-Alexandrium_andersonii.AAC.1